jgi:diazepam-binding inhibitor (GABA receptor modulator, acyl-CoA-binding protein)
MDLNTQFQEAATKVNTLTVRPTNEELLALYSLFKQATEGDVAGEKPGIFDFKGAAKYAAWESLKGMNQASAMEAYIAKVNQIMETYQ